MPLPAALSLDLRGRSLTRIRDWTAAEIEAVLDLADELKAQQREREPHRLLEGRTLGLLFRKHSTRTRVSLEPAAGVVVLRTPPACANAVAIAFDDAALPEVAGCIAGDDTIFVAPRDGTTAADLAEQLRHHLDGDT